MTAGPGPVAAGAGSAKLRLLVSAVKPCATQVGLLSVPLLTRVRVTTVVPALKLVALEQQSPKMLNSAVFHCSDRLTTVSAAMALALPPGEVSTTGSVAAPAVPVSVVPCSCAAVTAGARVLAELNQQLFPDWFHGWPAGHTGPKLISQYSINTQGPPHWFCE